jgi:hypothetical protein
MAKKKPDPRLVMPADFRSMLISVRRAPKTWCYYTDLLPQTPAELLWKEGDEFHYKKEELQWLPPAHFEVIMRLLFRVIRPEQEMNQIWFEDLTTEDLNLHLNLWRPCEGCVPDSEIGDELLASITNKFRFPLEVACDMAEILHKETISRGKKTMFQPVPIVEPSHEDSTYYAIIDWDRHIKYLFGYDKAWCFKWHSLTAFANWILACTLRTVQVFRALKDNEGKLRNVQTDARYRSGSRTHEFSGKIVVPHGQ